MAANKPIAYPNLMDALTTVVDSHVKIHATVQQHADNHVTTLENKRRTLSIQRDADRLMTTDNPSTHDTSAG